jgi:NAD(P)-dependent dehydrogenase (short-subunit alcohol dehydrogenase family)
MSAPGQPKTCVVLGGSGVVGSALVRELAEAGARVAFTFLRGRSVADEVQRRAPAATAHELDLSDPAAVASVVERMAHELGCVDAIVHAAAQTSTCDPPRFDRIEDVDFEAWDALMRVNVTSAFAAVRAALPWMKRGGNVVLFGSVDGIKPVPSPVPYAVSKAAARGLVLSLAKALGGRQIRVNMIAPGVLEDGASRTLPDDLRAEYLRHAGLRRVGTIAEVTGLATWFALENTYVSGQTLLVDGGL